MLMCKQQYSSRYIRRKHSGVTVKLETERSRTKYSQFHRRRRRCCLVWRVGVIGV